MRREAGYDRRERHRCDGGVEQERVKIVGDRSDPATDACQDERKLADLKKRERNGQRHHVSVAKRPHHPRENEPLSGGHHGDDERERARDVATSSFGSSSIPTETKNSIPNRSRSGMTSLKA